MQTLKGRPSVFPSLHTLALSYYPFYFSDRSGKWNEITLRGYSEPIDLVENYGTSFMDTEDPLWDMYLTYVNDRTKLYDIRNPQATPHLYPMIQALKYNWIQIHDEKVEIHPEIFPDGAAEIWNAFWDSYNYTEPHPTGVALVLQTQFFQLTGTTPIDLQESTDEVEFYIGKGFPLNRIISSDST
jgi:hypothetical protein